MKQLWFRYVYKQAKVHTGKQEATGTALLQRYVIESIRGNCNRSGKLYGMLDAC